MLDITILKTTHSDEREARRLLPYIRTFNAFSLEAAGYLEEDAVAFEKVWASTMSTVSRTKFLRLLDKGAGIGGYDRGELLYFRKAADYMFREGVVAYFAERWKDRQSAEEVNALRNKGMEELLRGVGLIRAGRIDEGVNMCYKGSLSMHRSQTKRDENIAQNIERAEHILRTTYTNLAGLSDITLGIQIGSWHKPEKYTKTLIPIVNLIGEQPATSVVFRRINDMFYEGADLEQLTPLFTEFAQSGKVK